MPFKFKIPYHGLYPIGHCEKCDFTCYWYTDAQRKQKYQRCPFCNKGDFLFEDDKQMFNMILHRSI